MTLTRAWMKELMYSDCVQRRRVAGVLALLVHVRLHGVVQRGDLVPRRVLEQLQQALHARDAGPTGDVAISAAHVLGGPHGQEGVGALVAVADTCHHLLDDGGFLPVRPPGREDGEASEGGVGVGVEQNVDGVVGALGDHVAEEEDVVQLAVRERSKGYLHVSGQKRVQCREIDGSVFG